MVAPLFLPARDALRLPTAAECPPMLVCREVVRHPAGGWTVAAPIDATRSTARVYRGRWRRHADAVAALEEGF